MRISFQPLICLLGIALCGGCATTKLPTANKKFVITEFGAVADGTTLNTQSIQNLIDRCSFEGGGTIIVPKGTFLTGSLFFKKGTNLQIEKDGILRGSTKPTDYPIVNTRWEGTERPWIAALINFTDMSNVTLSGEGMIDGQGTQFQRGGGRGRGAGGPPTQPAIARGPATQGARPPGSPRLICFQNCTNVRVSNINCKDEASWCLHILYCRDVVVENVTVRAAHTIPSSDGMDIDSSKNVRVTGCDIDVNDDCISIKSGKDADGLRVNRPAEDIIIEKTRFAYGHGGAAMGSEVSGGIRNVEIRDCVVDAGNWAPIRFKSQPSRSGVVENITYRNIEIKNARSAFDFNMAWRMVNPLPPAKVLTKVRNVRIINLTGTVQSVGAISGLEGSPIEGITFENCNLTARTGLRISNAVKVDTAGLKLNLPEGVQPITYRNATTEPAE